MLYFVLKNDRKLGPFTESQLQELLSAGLISANDRAWKVEESEGTPLDQMFAGEQDPAEEELDTVHSSPIAVSQGIRPQEMETVSAGAHPAHQWDDSVVGPDVPHSRGTGIPDVPTWPSERAPLNLDMDMDRLSSVDAILPLKVAVDYQERPFPAVLSDDPQPEATDNIECDAVVADVAPAESDVADNIDTPVEMAEAVLTEQDDAADFLETAEFPLTPLAPAAAVIATDVCAEDIVAEVAVENGINLADVDEPVAVMPVVETVAVSIDAETEAPENVVVTPVIEVETVEAEAVIEPQVEATVPDVVDDPVIPVGLEAFFNDSTPAEPVSDVVTSTELVPVTAVVVDDVPPAPRVQEAVAEIAEPVIPVAAPVIQTSSVESSLTGFQPAATLSQPAPAPAPAPSVASERRTAAERRAEDAEINDVCSRIEARLAERRMRSSNVRVVPTGGIAIFGGLLYAIPFVSLAVYGFAIQIATAGTFRITASVVPYLIEAAAALLFHAYGVVVGHKVLTGDQKGRVYAERHLELRRFILPAIWMTLFFVAGPGPDGTARFARFRRCSIPVGPLPVPATYLLYGGYRADFLWSLGYLLPSFTTCG